MDELNFTLGKPPFFSNGPELLVNDVPVVDASIPNVISSPRGQSVEVHVGGIASYLDVAHAGCCYHYLNYKVSFSKSAIADPFGHRRTSWARPRTVKRPPSQ